MGGKSDHGTDWCEIFDWYGDGICDDFCVNPDPDCEPVEPPPAANCGGIAGLTCADGEYCAYELDQMCGAADQLGTCETIPDVCAAVIDPVCGCDGNTYQNACQAATSGVSVAAEGPCQNSNVCGGIAGIQCPADQFCEFDEGSCGEFDMTGSCRPFSEFCTQQFDPVCGCDGQTYSNRCFAHSAGVSVRHAGECDAPQGTFCGGFLGQTCGADEFCNYDDSAGSACGIADGGGTCEKRPEACIQLFDPVCGCDGKTYSNSCMANAAGVDVMSEGACN